MAAWVASVSCKGLGWGRAGVEGPPQILAAKVGGASDGRRRTAVERAHVEHFKGGGLLKW